MRYSTAMHQLAAVRSQHAEASQRAQTGRRLTAPSDDPIAAAELLQLSSRSAAIQGNRTTIRMVRGDAELAEGVLAEAGSLMQQAHELAMQGASDQMSPAGRQHLADQVSGLRAQLLGIANTVGSNGYVFAGSQTATPPFTPGGAFVGDDVAHAVDIGTGAPVRVNASGQSAFTAAGGRDVFADLDALITALGADDGDGVRAELTNLQNGHDQIQTERGQAGLVMNKMQTSDTALERAELLSAQQDQQVGGADDVQAYSDLVTLGQALERSIGVARQLLSLGNLSQF
jgi:flagellar hook-associated protein 3 FlgL